MMSETRQPPQAALEAIKPLSHAITALAVLTDRAIRQLRLSYRENLPDQVLPQIEANITSTMEAGFWANSVACWVESTCPPSTTVDKLHEVAWPEWEVGPFHVRIEREAHYARSGRRDAYNHQVPLFEYSIRDEAPQQWAHVDPDQARNVTGTMVRDEDGVVTGVVFRAIFGTRALWQLTVSAEMVQQLINSWAPEDPWVILAQTPATWAAGYGSAGTGITGPAMSPDPGPDLTPGPNAERPPSTQEDGYEGDSEQAG